jgi:thymidylate synthase (FAD)
MTEENKFKEVDSIQLYNDNIGYVKLYDASHTNESEEQRIWTVTTTASLAYGNEEAKNPEALYERMKSIKHESLWEFVRIGDESYNSIEGSMRCKPKLYETEFNNTFDVNTHKENIACFRIKVPIFIARQFMRHRSKSYLEMSRRYTKASKVPFEWFCDYGSDEANALVDAHHKAAYDLYKTLISMGVETQKASRIIGQDVYTEFYTMGEVEGLKNYFRLRLDSHAQKEIREVAEAMIKLLENHQPELYSKVI